MRVDKSVIVLFRQMNLFLNRELLDEKLTSSDVLYLALLYEQDGRTQDEMAEAYTVDRAATTRSLQGVEKKGLVRREVDTFDRRIRRVYLTEKAMQYRTAIRRMADDLADALFEGMSEEEVKAFMEQVEAMGQRRRLWWGLGQRPNRFTGDQYAKCAQQRRRQRSVPASNFALPQERPQLALFTTCILSRPLARPTIPKQK